MYVRHYTSMDFLPNEHGVILKNILEILPKVIIMLTLYIIIKSCSKNDL